MLFPVGKEVNVRSLLFLIVLTVCALPAEAQAPSEGYERKTVISVIEEFRSQGFAFAYSTNLVTDDLIVLAEPTSDGTLDIAREILEPHGLTIRAEEGLWLIVRSDSAAARLGSLLIVVRDRRDLMTLDDLEIVTPPDIKAGRSPGAKV